MLQFIKENKSLSLVFLSTILTGCVATESLASLFVHVVNLGLLLAMRVQARDNKNYRTTSILILVAVGLTAVMTTPTEGRIVIEIVNFGLLILVAWLAGQEAIFTEWLATQHPTHPVDHGEKH